MTDAAATQPRTRGRWRVWVILAAAAVAIIGGITVLGGFKDVPVETLPELSLGETHHGNEVDTVITSVYLTSRLPGREYDADEGVQYLVVDATLLNTTDTPDTLTSELLRVVLDGQVTRTDDPRGPVDPRTGNAVGFLQPGLPVRTVFWWEVSDTASEGDDLVIGLFERFPVDDPRFDGTAYSAPKVTATIDTTIGATE